MKKLFYILMFCLVAIQCAFAAVDINSASEAELDGLPGIGPVKARAIVEERSKGGPFKSIDDIKRVKGIGDVTFVKLKSEITVGGATASAPSAQVKMAVKNEKKAAGIK